VTSEGYGLGSLCVIDYRPRELTPAQLRALEVLARMVVGALEARRVAARLAETLERVETLSGLLPICMYCKRIRDDHDYWREVETYVQNRAPVEFSHGICPRCVQERLAD